MSVHCTCIQPYMGVYMWLDYPFTGEGEGDGEMREMKERDEDYPNGVNHFF